MRNLKCYSELVKLNTFEERFQYLSLNGSVGKDTFGYDRYLNQKFYKSNIWKRIRRDVIIRDNGCDLGIPGRELDNGIYIHHMNPVTREDILNQTDLLLNPEFLICVSDITHNAIHYGDGGKLFLDPLERRKNDTCPWKDKGGS